MVVNLSSSGRGAVNRRGLWKPQGPQMEDLVAPFLERVSLSFSFCPSLNTSCTPGVRCVGIVSPGGTDAGKLCRDRVWGSLLSSLNLTSPLILP